ncbi:hypothetical protein Tco_0326132, partial [Tanacetum coccineum]
MVSNITGTKKFLMYPHFFTTSTVVSTATVAHPSTSFAPSTVEKASSPLRDPTNGNGCGNSMIRWLALYQKVT